MPIKSIPYQVKEIVKKIAIMLIEQDQDFDFSKDGERAYFYLTEFDITIADFPMVRIEGIDRDDSNIPYLVIIIEYGDDNE